MSLTATVYGIPNCDTVKKARAWLAEQGIAYTFHDFKKQGVPAERLPQWIASLGWEKLLNRQGTTWRKLDAAVQARGIAQEQALAAFGGDPRQDLPAEQADDGAGTARAVEAKGFGVAKAEGFNAGFHRESDWFEE